MREYLKEFYPQLEDVEKDLINIEYTGDISYEGKVYKVNSYRNVLQMLDGDCVISYIVFPSSEMNLGTYGYDSRVKKSRKIKQN